MIPYRYKPVGVLLLLTGVFFSVIYFVHRVDWSVPVFAIISSYMETGFFKVLNNNIFEELIMLSYLSGFMIIAFSNEKEENHLIRKIRAESWQKAVLINSLFLIASILFVYGTGFIGIVFANLVLVYAIYLVIFHTRRKRGVNQ